MDESQIQCRTWFIHFFFSYKIRVYKDRSTTRLPRISYMYTTHIWWKVPPTYISMYVLRVTLHPNICTWDMKVNHIASYTYLILICGKMQVRVWVRPHLHIPRLPILLYLLVVNSLSDRMTRFEYVRPTGLTQNARPTIFVRKHRPWTAWIWTPNRARSQPKSPNIPPKIVITYIFTRYNFHLTSHT